MAAYLIADVDVTDAAAFEEYRREVPETERHYGGRYLGRGGATKVLEGDWEPHRLVIIEFPGMASLMAWYNSPEYAPTQGTSPNLRQDKDHCTGGCLTGAVTGDHARAPPCLHLVRTSEDRAHDYSAKDGELAIGHVYRHSGGGERGKWRWSMYANIGNRMGTDNGTADSRDEACRLVEESYRRFLGMK